MKKLLIIIFCVTSLLVKAPLYAQESSIVVIKSESHGVFTDLYKSIWVRLKLINPQMDKHLVNSEQVPAAGIRGKLDDTLLKPYWGKDLIQAEVAVFSVLFGENGGKRNPPGSGGLTGRYN
jgi:hypothetical protein